MLNNIRTTAWRALIPKIGDLFCVAAVLVAGCERAPQPVSELPALPQPLVLAEDQTGSYDWPVGAAGFIVAKPSPFAFLRNAEPTAPDPQADPQVATATEPIDDETVADLLRSIGTRLDNPFALSLSVETSMEVPVTDPESLTYCLSPEGDRLLVCSEQIDVYDTETGQRLSSEKALGSAVQASLWPVGDHFYVADASTVFRADANTGKILGPVGSLAGKLAMWQSALNAEIVFGCYESGSVFRFDDQSNQLKELAISVSGPKKQLAVKPDGMGVILTSARGLATYLLQDDRIVSEEVNAVKQMGDTVTVCWTPGGRHWSDGKRFYSYPGSANAEQKSTLTVSTPLVWRPIVMNAATYSGTANEGWANGIVMRKDMNGNSTISVCEVLPTSLIHSVPTAIPVSEQTPIAFNRSGRVLAFLNGAKLQIARRNTWDHCSLSRLRGGGMLTAGEFEKIDLMGRYLLETDDIRWGFLPQELYAAMVAAAARNWLQLKYAIDAEADEVAKSKMRETFDAARDWAKSSLSGKLALADLRLRMAWDAREGRDFPAGSPTGWDLYQQQNERAKKELDALLEDADAPAYAYAMRIEAGKRIGESHASLEPLLKRGVARHANNYDVNADVVQWLMPRWSGSYGDSAGYLSAVLKRVDQPAADIMYARVAASMLQWHAYPDEMYFQHKFDDARVIRGGQLYLEQNPTDRITILYMLATANYAKDQPAEQQLAKYYQSHFMFVDHAFAKNYFEYITAVYNEQP